VEPLRGEGKGGKEEGKGGDREEGESPFFANRSTAIYIMLNQSIFF